MMNDGDFYLHICVECRWFWADKMKFTNEAQGAQCPHCEHRQPVANQAQLGGAAARVLGLVPSADGEQLGRVVPIVSLEVIRKVVQAKLG